MANRNIYHAMRRSVHLTDEQRDVVIGTLLGDGSLIETFSKNNLRLQIAHGSAQKEYVFWKYEALKSLVLTPPSYQPINDSWWFRTISHPEFTEIGRLFYRDRIKIVPLEIASLLTPIGLAVWFMDDGAHDRSFCYILNTQCFRKDEQERLRNDLAARFGINNISIHKDKTGWRLYIRKASAERFAHLVRPFVLPSLQYKLKAL